MRTGQTIYKLTSSNYIKVQKGRLSHIYVAILKTIENPVPGSATPR